MASLLSNYTQGRDNNFNMLRLIAAVMVLFTHSYALTGNAAAEPLFRLTGYLAGEIAVNVFFITSGFLVTRSLFVRKNLLEFAWARFLRIYPALAVGALLCAIPLGLLFTDRSVGAYLSDRSVYQFLLANATLITGPIRYYLPGVFQSTPYPYVVNGSVWTLVWEVRLYAVLVVLALFAWRKNRTDGNRFGAYLVALSVLVTIGYIANRIHPLYYGGGMLSTLRFGSLFFLGSSFYVLRDRIILSHRIFFVILALLVAGASKSTFYFLLMTLSLPYTVFYLAYVPGGWIRAYNKLGDYSYGTYLYAFPVQQALAALFPGMSVRNMFFSSLSVTLVFAVLSWHLLEKRMLKKKEAHVHLRNALSRLGFRNNAG